MARQEMTVSELVADIERGRIKKPEMQREYVWKAPRVRDLLDSLYRGYPSGTILLWDSREKVTTSDFALKTDDNSIGSTLLLLDGQQRLTSLSSVIRGEPIVIRSKKKLRQIDILFNLEHPDDLLTVTEIDDSLEDSQFDDDDDDDNEMICKSNFVMAKGHKVLEKYQDAENLLLAAQELVAKSSDWPQITKIERELISIYRLTERSAEADEAERRLSTLTEVVL